MSYLNFRDAKREELFKGAQEDIPEGKYSGSIVSAEVKKTAAGHKQIAVKLKLDTGREVMQFLNTEHPNSAAITQETLFRIFCGGLVSPPHDIDTVEQVATALKGVPVAITLKHDGKNAKGYTQYKIYFNDVPTEKKKGAVTVTSNVPF